jgi:hypothetical protein
MEPRSLSGAAPLPPAIEAFLGELAELGDARLVHQMRASFATLMEQGLECDDHENLLSALWRVAAQPISLGARLASMQDILSQRNGRVVVTIGRDTISIQSRPS